MLDLALGFHTELHVVAICSSDEAHPPAKKVSRRQNETQGDKILLDALDSLPKHSSRDCADEPPNRHGEVHLVFVSTPRQNSSRCPVNPSA
jgi:hypothetical protein